MSEMVKRVADAIVAANVGEYTSEGQADKLARAAIKAMREPTDAMIMDVGADWGQRTWRQYKYLIDRMLSE